MSDSDDDLLANAKTEFELCEADPAGNRQAYRDDTRFVRLLEQWPREIAELRKNRPCLTIDKLGPVVRQVVNDARQNKPSIKVHPVDSGADKKTAEVLDGLIRNIEYASNADVAYDTAVECSAGGGFGYFRIGVDFAHDDVFEKDISIDRIPNPLCVYGDPNSTAADSGDWNIAFVVNRLTKAEYEAEYGDDEPTDWESDAWKGAWLTDEGVMVAERWHREEYTRTIIKTASGQVFDKAALAEDPDLATALEAGLIEIVDERETKCYRVTQTILSGARVLKKTKWPGKYIPIIAVYGDEFWVDGVRYLRSLIHGAIDAQKMFNVMRSTAAELFGLSPKVPFIGPKGAFDTDILKWNTMNSANHPFVEYDGQTPPIRLPLDPGPASGAMQEALAASDDIKGITGIHDASLGQRSNETSGRAIMARQRQGDISTFHFIDNLRRSIRHAGRVIVDLIPHYYDRERVVRVVGEDGKEESAQLNKPFPQVDPKTGQPMMQPMTGPDGQPVMQPPQMMMGPDGAPMPGPDGMPAMAPPEPLMEPVMAMHDLTTGRYDVTVGSGPSFTSRREEAAYSMTEALRAFPAGAPIIMPELAKNLDWPGADKIAEKLEAQASQQLPPEVQKLIEEGKAKIAELERQVQDAQAGQAMGQQKLQASVQEAQMKFAADGQIAEMQIASDEKIAMMKIKSEADLAALRAHLSAQAEAQRPIAQAQLFAA